MERRVLCTFSVCFLFGSFLSPRGRQLLSADAAQFPEAQQGQLEAPRSCSRLCAGSKICVVFPSSGTKCWKARTLATKKQTEGHHDDSSSTM